MLPEKMAYYLKIKSGEKFYVNWDEFCSDEDREMQKCNTLDLQVVNNRSF